MNQDLAGDVIPIGVFGAFAAGRAESCREPEAIRRRDERHLETKIDGLDKAARRGPRRDRAKFRLHRRTARAVSQPIYGRLRRSQWWRSQRVSLTVYRYAERRDEY